MASLSITLAFAHLSRGVPASASRAFHLLAIASNLYNSFQPIKNAPQPTSNGLLPPLPCGRARAIRQRARRWRPHLLHDLQEPSPPLVVMRDDLLFPARSCPRPTLGHLLHGAAASSCSRCEVPPSPALALRVQWRRKRLPLPTVGAMLVASFRLRCWGPPPDW